jgi:2-octaprenyl-6-methoxyphenol hydroxylase
MRADCDILVAGGGIVGTSLALALAQAGFAVLLCDPLPAETRADPEFDGRAYAVAAACQRMFAALGLWDGLAPHAEPMREILVADTRAGASPPPWLLHFDHREGEGGPFAAMLEDRYLRRALLRAVAAEPRIVHRAPAAIAGFEAGSGAIVATLADGQAVAARLLVACDGRRSPVARVGGISWVGRDYDQTGLVAALEHERPHDGIARQLFLPAGPLALLPLPENRTSVVWTERPAAAAALMAMPPAAYYAELRLRIGDVLGPTRLAGRRWSYALSLALAQSWVRPRLAVAGDAAHGIHPLAGQGLNLGLKDVAALAEVLAEARRRGEDIGALDVLRRYEAWRRFDTVALAIACDGLERLFSNDIAPLRALRDLGMAAAGGLGAARRLFMREAAGEAGDLPRLLRGEAP